MTQSQEALLDCTLTLLCFSIFSFIWFVFWVQPSDARNLAIAQCQLDRGDRSFESYQACLQSLQPSSHTQGTQNAQ